MVLHKQIFDLAGKFLFGQVRKYFLTWSNKFEKLQTFHVFINP